MLENISFSELEKVSNVKIIDIRDYLSYKTYHIDNSINVPYEKLLINPNKYLNKTEKYYIYCQKGIESLTLCRILNNMGFSTVNIIGGINAIIKK